MDVPVQLRALAERGVDGGEEPAGKNGRKVGADEMVGEGGEEEFVDVKGESGEVEGSG